MAERGVQPVFLREAVRGFEGRWVALKGGRIVEARDTGDAVYVALREQSIRGATIIRVPAIGEPEFVGLG